MSENSDREIKRNLYIKIYTIVIHDLMNDFGWEPEALKTTLSVLKSRRDEIKNVHPKLFAEPKQSE